MNHPKQISKESYIEAIPKSCALKTYEQHEKIYLCNRLKLYLKNYGPIDCSECRYVTNDDSTWFRRIINKINNLFDNIG